MNIVLKVLAGVGALALSTVTASAQSAYCDGVARNYANNYSNAGNNVVGGALLGALGGAAIGGIAGGSKGVGTGAAIGAVGGGLVGAANSNWQGLYNQAYNDCIRRQPVAAPQPGGYYAPWSPEWYQACSRNYRSFNSNPNWPGYYLGYDNQYHFCTL
ncbi:MAG: hypothetical protein U1E56_12465 [Bauldia sp.]